MAASFSGFPANQSPFIIKFFKRLLSRRRLGRPTRSRGRVAGFYGLSRLTAYLTLSLFLCSTLAAPQALAGQVIEISGNVSGSVYGNGPYYNNLDPNNNFVDVLSGSWVEQNVYGAYASSRNAAAQNNVVISYGTVGWNVCGGCVYGSSNGGYGTLAAQANTVAISGGTVGVAVNGGAAVNGDQASAADNRAIIYGTVKSGVRGGYADGYEEARATHNQVSIGYDAQLLGQGGVLNGDVFGGYASSRNGTAEATDNSFVTGTYGGTVSSSVYGGYADSPNGTAAATGNRVENKRFSPLRNQELSVAGDVFGGYADSFYGNATAKDNVVDLAESSVGGRVYGGNAKSYRGTAKAAENSVSISDKSSVSRVYGGNAYIQTGGIAEAAKNSVSISGQSTVNWNVFGGLASTENGTAEAVENEITLNDSTVGGDVYGGHADGWWLNEGWSDEGGGFHYGGGSSTASGNSATISGGGTVGGSVLGGNADGSTKNSATSNTVAIIGGTVDWNDYYSSYSGVYGGRARGVEADAADNSVSISDKSMVRGGYVFGGYAGGNGSATATGNSVAISDSTVDGTMVVELDEDEGGGAGPVIGPFGFGPPQEVVIVTGGDVYGGYARSIKESAEATGNSVSLSDQSTVRGGDVIGGFALSEGGRTATASGNSVAIIDSTVDRVIADWVYGGSVYGGKADRSGQSSASDNTVTINGSTVDLAVYGGFAQGIETAGAAGNRVDLNGGSRVGAEVYGGFAYDGQASATGNTVAISGGGLVRGDVFGGLASSGNGSATAKGNKVEMSGGTLDWANLYGGYAYSLSGTATASENSLSISGDSILRGDVFGGYANSFNGTARATGNTVDISGDPNFGQNTIYGGYTNKGDSFTGNTLNKNSPVNIQNVKNFEYINFGHGGQAGIANLDTTPTGSSRPGVVLNTYDAPLNFNGVIYGSGALAKTGAETLTLSGANTYTGLTEVRQGTLALAGAGRISNSLALYNQTTFNSGGKNLNLNSLEVKNLAAGGSAANLKAPSVVIGPQGTVEVGLNTLNISGNAYFTGGSDSTASTYKLAGNGQNTGLITVSGQAQIGEGAKLAYTGSFENLTGKTILTAARFNDGTYFKNPLLSFQFRDYADHTDLVVTGQRNIGDVTNSISPGGNSSNAGAVIQGMPYSELKNKLLLNVQDFALADDQAQADKALRQFIGEGSLNAVNAHYDTVTQMASALDGRVQTLLEGQSAPAAGNGPTENRLWLKPFGQWNRQDDENGALGYRYHSGGLMLGYDRETAQPGLTLGLYGAVSKGVLENDLAETDIQTTGLGLYGLYEFGGGNFADLNFGYGHSDNESNIDLVFGGRKTSKFSTDSFQTGLNFGRIFQLNQDTTLTPSAGLRYTQVKQNGWQEKIVSDPDHKVVANWFGDSRQDFVEIPLNLKLATTFETGGRAAVTPEVHVGGIIAAKHPKSELRMGFVGSDESTTISGLAPGRGRLTTGAGVKSQLSETLDISVNYDLEFRKGYQGHSAYAVLGVSF